MSREARVLSHCVLAIAVLCALPACHRRVPPLRVCADPNNLPFSNDRGEGFENRIAELLAAERHARVEYTWWAQRRGFIRVEVEVKGRRVSFVTTHLDWQHEDGRLFEARQLLDALASINGPVIVTGDFNEESNGGAYQLMLKSGFADAWSQTRLGIAELPGDGATYPADKPSKRIDFIFYRVDGKTRSLGEAVLNTSASDHRPLGILFSL